MNAIDARSKHAHKRYASIPTIRTFSMPMSIEPINFAHEYLSILQRTKMLLIVLFLYMTAARSATILGHGLQPDRALSMLRSSYAESHTTHASNLEVNATNTSISNSSWLGTQSASAEALRNASLTVPDTICTEGQVLQVNYGSCLNALSQIPVDAITREYNKVLISPVIPLLHSAPYRFLSSQ